MVGGVLGAARRAHAGGVLAGLAHGVLVRGALVRADHVRAVQAALGHDVLVRAAGRARLRGPDHLAVVVAAGVARVLREQLLDRAQPGSDGLADLERMPPAADVVLVLPVDPWLAPLVHIL